MSTLMAGGNPGRVVNLPSHLADLEDSASDVVGTAQEVLGESSGWTRRQVDLMADLRS